MHWETFIRILANRFNIKPNESRINRTWKSGVVVNLQNPYYANCHLRDCQFNFGHMLPGSFCMYATYIFATYERVSLYIHFQGPSSKLAVVSWSTQSTWVCWIHSCLGRSRLPAMDANQWWIIPWKRKWFIAQYHKWKSLRSYTCTETCLIPANNNQQCAFIVPLSVGIWPRCPSPKLK